MPLLLRNAALIRQDRIEPGVSLLLDGGVIARMGRDLSAGDAEVWDATGLLVASGLIDVHIHGAGGAMCEEAKPESVARISSTLARFGVAGFLATVATLPSPHLRAAVAAIASVMGHEPGARILGIHLEGPYLSPLRAGAQMLGAMRPPSIAEFDELQALAGGRIRLVTLAPEIDGALPFIAAMRARGVIVAAGHSNATAAEMRAGLAAGATHVTHLFNAMRELHHREPGVIGVALTDENVSVELICDGHHLAPEVVDLAFRCKPPGKVVLVSDAVGALGMPEGEYEMFGVSCVIRGGAVRLTHGGNLAGSCLSLDQALRNIRRWLPRIPLPDLVGAASTAAAAVIGEASVGGLTEGQPADLVVFNDALEVVATLCRGRPVWSRVPGI